MRIAASTPPSPVVPVPATRVARELLGEEPLLGVDTVWTQPVEHGQGPVDLAPMRLRDGTVVVNGESGTSAFSPEGQPLWKLDLGDCSYRPPVPGPGDVLYLRTGDGQVAAIEARASGARLLWQSPVGERGTSAAPVAGPDGLLYVAAEDRALHVLGPDGAERGRLEWEHLQSEEPRFLADGRLVLEGYDGFQAVVDPHAPPRGLTALWKKEGPRLEREISSSVLQPVGLGPDGTEYRTEGSCLKAFAPGGKTLLWEHDLGQKATSSHVTLREDGAVYVLTGDRHLTVLSPKGEELWTWSPDGPVSRGYVIDDRGTAYFTGAGANHQAYAVDSQGQQKWAARLSSHAEGPAVGPRNTLILGGDMAPFRLLDLENGHLLHEGPDLAFGGHPFAASQDGRLVIATEEGNLVGLHLRTPEVVRERLSQADPTARPEIRAGRSTVIIGGVELPIRTA